MNTRLANSSKRFVSWVVVLMVIAVLTFATLADAPRAEATNVSPDGIHWRRSTFFGSLPIPLALRNQIGPGFEAQVMNYTIASWGSVSANNPYPSGPARTDFLFAYQYGGAPSCSWSSPFKVVTFCVRPVPGSGLNHTSIDSNGHVVTSWIEIDPVYRYASGAYCHEFGHSLGLYHGTASSCLYYMYLSGSPDPGQHSLDLSRTVNNNHTHFP